MAYKVEIKLSNNDQVIFKDLDKKGSLEVSDFRDLLNIEGLYGSILTGGNIQLGNMTLLFPIITEKIILANGKSQAPTQQYLDNLDIGTAEPLFGNLTYALNFLAKRWKSIKG